MLLAFMDYPHPNLPRCLLYIRHEVRHVQSRGFAVPEAGLEPARIPASLSLPACNRYCFSEVTRVGPPVHSKRGPMQEGRSRRRRPPSPRCPRAVLALTLCLAASTIIGGTSSGEAWASDAPVVISPREVDPAVGFVSGRVESSNDGGASWAPLPVGARVPRQALVRTGADGNCILFCTDDCLVAMKAGATIQILPQLQTLRLLVLAGEAWVRFPYVVESDRNGVGLPRATVLAVGAGDYGFAVTDGASVAKVLEGSALVVPQGGNAQVSLSSGQSLDVGPNGPGATTAFDVALERSGWQSLLGQADVPVTTTTLSSVTTTHPPLPPDGPVGTPTSVIVMLLILGAGALWILAIIGAIVYLCVNRLNRHRRVGR
jgi:hypothetical protein